MNTKQLIYLLLSLITLIAGYAFLRYAFNVTDSMPFTQEIVLVILGTIATIFITALLLNKQTSVEIEKEQSIKFLDLKTTTYGKLFDILEEMSLVENFDNRNLINLQFVTHRLAIIASPDVLKEYKYLLKTISQVSQDNSFSGDSEVLHKALAQLTIKIREDLTDQWSSSKYSTAQIAEMIEKNSGQSVSFVKDDNAT